jgi:predicted SnoaL-like aldol condensation-catalyzing enzyme
MIIERIPFGLLSRHLAPAALASSALLLGLGCSDDEPASTSTERAALSAEEQSNLLVAQRVLREGLIGGDTDVVNQLVREDYVQHNLQAMDGRAGLLAFIGFLQTQEGNAVEFHRLLANDDFVAVHVTYGTGAGRTVAFDVFRLENGQLAEHWDALTPWVEASASANGNTLVDGPTEVTDRPLTEQNRELVLEYIDVVFRQGRIDALPEYIGEPFVQHNPALDNGVDALRALLESEAAAGRAVEITGSPLVVADGNFVFVGSYAGGTEDRPDAAYYDLFRVEGGKIVEHWDIVPPLPDPESVPHDNGVF